MNSRRPVTIDFPIAAVRAKFPALERAAPFIYFDNAAGSQAPRSVLDAVARHLLDFNVQRGGRYEKSREVDRVIATAREKLAVWLNATDPGEVCFGMNATRFPGFERSSAPDLMRPAMGEVASPNTVRPRPSMRRPTRSSVVLTASSST